MISIVKYFKQSYNLAVRRTFHHVIGVHFRTFRCYSLLSKADCIPELMATHHVEASLAPSQATASLLDSSTFVCSFVHINTH